MSRTAGLLLVSASLLVLAPRALAQDTTQEISAQPAPEGGTELSDQQAMFEEGAPTDPSRDELDPTEREGENYYFVGLLARALVIPSYPFEVGNVTFPAGYSVPVDGGFGAFFNYRRNGFNIQLEVFYQSYYWDGFIVGAGDSLGETENIHSELGVIYGWFGFSWSIPIVEWFAIEIGVGLGVGGMIGNLYRQEAYQDAGGAWHECEGFNNPATGEFCADNGTIERPGPDGRLDDTRTQGATLQRSENTPNPFYFGEGGVPPIFATIDLPRVSFRFKPIRQIQIRVDTAFNLYGFSFGGSAGYGF